MGGINGQAALEGTMLGPGILMGRVAAKHCTKRLERTTKPQLREPEPLTLTESKPTYPPLLEAWREATRQVIAEHHRGFFHFEKVHETVLARNYDCAKCHVIKIYHLEHQPLIGSCIVCHGGVTER